MREMIKSIGETWTKDVTVGVAASLLLALCAPLSIHLPFTPVPVTIQVQVALFLSALMGGRRAIWMILAFISQGLMGLPVFAGGASTIATLVGPRGGYLIGYLVAGYIVGSIYQSRENKSAMTLFLSMIIGNLIIYITGFSWLSGFVGIQKAFQLGIYPFIFPDLIKIALFGLGSHILQRKKSSC